MDYSELYDIITKARLLHRMTHDEMLPSAIEILTPYTNHPDPDNITLEGTAIHAAECINKMWEAKETLYG